MTNNIAHEVHIALDSNGKWWFRLGRNDEWLKPDTMRELVQMMTLALDAIEAEE